MNLAEFLIQIQDNNWDIAMCKISKFVANKLAQGYGDKFNFDKYRFGRLTKSIGDDMRDFDMVVDFFRKMSINSNKYGLNLPFLRLSRRCLQMDSTKKMQFCLHELVKFEQIWSMVQQRKSIGTPNGMLIISMTNAVFEQNFVKSGNTKDHNHEDKDFKDCIKEQLLRMEHEIIKGLANLMVQPLIPFLIKPHWKIRIEQSINHKKGYNKTHFNAVFCPPPEIRGF